MRFDRTRISIRERSMFEVNDLALHVLRSYFRPVLALGLVGIIPFQFLNWWLLSYYFSDDYATVTAYLYIWLTGVLVSLEAPVATLLVTGYLGQSVFAERPLIQSLLGGTWRVKWQILFSLLFLRGVLPALGLVFIAYLTQQSFDETEAAAAITTFLTMGWMVVMLIRVARPFAPEVIVLEQNPILSKSDQTPSLSQRLSHIHLPNSGIVVGRSIVGIGYFCLIFGALLGSLYTVWGITFYEFAFDWIFYSIIYPAALWGVVVYATIVRFLNYLDVRIRQEGWEIELLLRTEGHKLREQIL